MAIENPFTKHIKTIDVYSGEIKKVADKLAGKKNDQLNISPADWDDNNPDIEDRTNHIYDGIENDIGELTAALSYFEDGIYHLDNICSKNARVRDLWYQADDFIKLLTKTIREMKEAEGKVDAFINGLEQPDIKEHGLTSELV